MFVTQNPSIHAVTLTAFLTKLTEIYLQKLHEQECFEIFRKLIVNNLHILININKHEYNLVLVDRPMIKNITMTETAMKAYGDLQTPMFCFPQ